MGDGSQVKRPNQQYQRTEGTHKQYTNDTKRQKYNDKTYKHKKHKSPSSHSSPT